MKLRYPLLLAATLVASSAAASAADGTINFEGEVTTNTCIVTPNLDGATIKLASVNEAAFSAVGATTARTKFDIRVTSCGTGVNTARAFFEANSDLVDYTTNSLKNRDTSTDKASGVGFALFEGDQRIVIGQFEGHGTTSRDIVAGGVVLPYEVAYVQTAEDVAAGKVNGQVQFSVHYN